MGYSDIGCLRLGDSYAEQLMPRAERCAVSVIYNWRAFLLSDAGFSFDCLYPHKRRLAGWSAIRHDSGYRMTCRMMRPTLAEVKKTI